jgi:hypothetical protein
VDDDIDTLESGAGIFAQEAVGIGDQAYEHDSQCNERASRGSRQRKLGLCRTATGL